MIMTSYKMSSDKMIADEKTVDEMIVEEMTSHKMSVDKMKCHHCLTLSNSEFYFCSAQPNLLNFLASAQRF